MASLIPENRARFTRDELLEATRGSSGAFDGEVSGVFTDSRGDLSGGLFVALRGERFDGHAFARVAAQHGARVLVVEEPVSDTGSAVVLRVSSTQRALGDLARFHRQRWGRRVVAVAGSVGKTTTRTAIFAVASAAGRVALCPPGNLNNLVGVPLVLLGLTQHHDLCVVELGTSLTGEIEQLTSVADPDVGVLTRVALEHAEGLGDLDAIEHEEGALLRGLRSNAVAVINGDDSRCSRQLALSAATRQVRYGFGAALPSPSYRILGQEGLGGGGTRVRIERPAAATLDVRSPLLGSPGAYALAAALASAEALIGRSLSGDEVIAALESPLLGEPGRLTPVELPDGSLILDDTYNSSPASVRSSVAVARELCELRGGRLVLVLGEMRELGPLSAAAHRDLGKDLVEARPALLVGFGGDAALFLEEPLKHAVVSLFAADALGALQIVLGQREPRDVILVKASRGLRAERVVEGLRAAAGAAA